MCALDIGNIRLYHPGLGVGQVSRTLFPDVGRRKTVLFHYETLQEADRHVARNLTREGVTDVRFWYVAEVVDGQEQVENIWLHTSLVPKVLLLTTLRRLTLERIDSDRTLPGWLVQFGERIVGPAKWQRLLADLLDEIKATQLAEAEKRASDLLYAQLATEQQRTQADSARRAKEEREHRRLIEEREAREDQIRNICVNREITTLVHFTRQENLASILELGLIGREDLIHRGLPFVPNDSERIDGCPNMVCLSVSFPNYQMFYKYREHPTVPMIVLVLPASILWENDCVFCVENAASSMVRIRHPSDRQSPAFLDQMFSDHHRNQRHNLSSSKHFPTHPQAEVLVHGFIEPSRILEVYFSSDDTRNTWMSGHPSECTPTLIVSDDYFKPRCEYKMWRKPDPLQQVDFFGHGDF